MICSASASGRSKEEECERRSIDELRELRVKQPPAPKVHGKLPLILQIAESVCILHGRVIARASASYSPDLRDFPRLHALLCLRQRCDQIAKQRPHQRFVVCVCVCVCVSVCLSVCLPGFPNLLEANG